MKTKIMTLALAAFAMSSALQAQEPAQKPAYKTSFVKDGKAHWFLEVGDAATISLAGNNRDAKFTDRVSLLNPSLAIGRWSTPAFGMRLSLQGGKLFDYARPAGMWLLPAGTTPAGGYLRHDVTYGFAQYEFLFDVVNYFAPYKENRFFHVIPFLGVGLGYKHQTEAIGIKDKGHRFSPLADAGLQLKFRLARFVDFNIDGKITASDLRLPSQSDHVKSGTDFIAQAGASLTFHLGRKAFEEIVPNDEALISDLNNQINALRAENAELAKRPVRCPDVEVPVADSKVIGNVIYFRINSAVIDKNQMINVYNIAEYAKNNTETITLVGYADRQTGNPSYNMALSKRRAEAVADILVKKYGISRDRLKIDWKGDTVQPYAENVWNRIVLMSAE